MFSRTLEWKIKTMRKSGVRIRIETEGIAGAEEKRETSLFPKPILSGKKVIKRRSVLVRERILRILMGSFNQVKQ